jgi:phytoene synthase
LAPAATGTTVRQERIVNVAVPPTGLAASHVYCQALARREAKNFYHAFRLLPRHQRRGTCALYAFLRIADDLSDEAGAPEGKRSALAAWRQQLGEAMQGHYHHPLHPALHETVKRFAIPVAYLEAVLDGVVMDLDVTCYATFGDLYQYCYRVASAVGLACIHIWGFRGERALGCAEAAGIAFQLTNVLRDLREDAARGRVYLPGEELDRFQYPAELLRQGTRNDRFRELMQFQVARARTYYEASAPLVDLLTPAGRAVFLVMLRTYAGILDAIEQRDYDVFSERVQLSQMKKLWLAARALPVRWGWTGQ